MDLARTYIDKLIYSGQQAKEKINKSDSELTLIDIQKALADLDYVEDRLLAAKILLRDELKTLKKKRRNEND
jgi:protein-arginine kinase activator protein McsA